MDDFLFINTISVINKRVFVTGNTNCVLMKPNLIIILWHGEGSENSGFALQLEGSLTCG